MMKTLIPDVSIALFVKNIMLFEELDVPQKTTMPFFADGYPGIMFQKTESGLFVMPHNKRMPDFFLYGQTIHPIELKIEGTYQLIVFQLYPFVIKNFFNVEPKTLNDDCYDLINVKNSGVENIISNLKHTSEFDLWQRIIADFLLLIFEQKREMLDFKIHQALNLIIENNGVLSISDIREKINIAERTFERRFIAEVGISPKQFSKMIQFQNTLEDIKIKDFDKLTDVVYKNGFADQSHCIKVFKAFTGVSPKNFKT